MNKREKGITLVILIITIIIMLILAGIGIASINILSKTKYNEKLPEMYLIQAKVKIINEKFNFNRDVTNLVGIKLKDQPNKAELCNGMLTNEELNSDYYYIYDQPTLNNIGLEGIKLENGEIYIINYENCDVMYPSGIDLEGGDKIYQLSEVDDLGITDTTHTHLYGGWKTYNDSNHKRTCICGNVQYESHQLERITIIKEATCTQTGTESYKCTVCGKVKIETIASLGHTPGAAATCTTAQTCTTCGTTIVAALKHNYTSKTTTSTYLKSEATCTTAATYYYKCSRCTAKGANTYTSGSALNHNMQNSQVNVVNNCTDGCLNKILCTRCGSWNGNWTVRAPGHSWIQNPSGGYGQVICSRCGNTNPSG